MVSVNGSPCDGLTDRACGHQQTPLAQSAPHARRHAHTALGEPFEDLEVRKLAASGNLSHYWKFSIIIRSAPAVALLLNRMVLRSGDTLRPVNTAPGIFVSTRLPLLENS